MIFGLLFLIGDEVQFENSVAPDKEYRSTISTVSTTSVDYKAAPEILDVIKQQGVTLPMKGNQEQRYTQIIKTGPLKQDGTFPFEQRFENVKTITQLNGDTLENEQNSFLNENTVIQGLYNEEKKAEITEIHSNSVTSHQKEALKKIVTDIQNSVKFPDHPLSVGDKFEQSAPISIPVQKLGNVQLSVNTKYTLTRIEREKAYFDLTIDYILLSDFEENNITAGGTGTGEMIYDLNQNFATTYTTDTNMDMEVYAGNLTVITKVNSKTTYKTTISDLK